MKIKQLLLSFITLSVFFVSCSKDDINSFEPQEIKTVQSQSVASTQASEPNLKAYIFIEQYGKSPMIKAYLNTLPSLVVGKMKFTGFHGVNGDAWKYNLPNYISMPHWTDGRLPQIVESEIPQAGATGSDSYGNLIQSYNFKTVKISKNTINDQFSWVVVLVPINAMNGDTKKQTKIQVVEKLGNVTTSSTIYTTDNVLSGTVINYNGNRIPAGQYRVYSTYPFTGMRLNFNTTKDVYIRGFSN